MRYSTLFLVLLAACSGQSNTAPVAPVGSATTTPALNDSADVAEARGKVLAVMRRQKAATLAKFAQASTEEKAVLEMAFESAIQTIATTPAKTPADLEKLTGNQVLKINEVVMLDARSRMVAKLPKRIGAEPMPGEKRDAADADGNCTNDLIVDVGTFQILEIDSSLKMTKFLISDSEVAFLRMRDTISTLVNRCDQIVERYGAKATCLLDEEENAGFSMEEFSAECQSMRTKFKQYL